MLCESRPLHLACFHALPTTRRPQHAWDAKRRVDAFFASRSEVASARSAKHSAQSDARDAKNVRLRRPAGDTGGMSCPQLLCLLGGECICGSVDEDDVPADLAAPPGGASRGLRLLDGAASGGESLLAGRPLRAGCVKRQGLLLRLLHTNCAPCPSCSARPVASQQPTPRRSTRRPVTYAVEASVMLVEGPGAGSDEAGSSTVPARADAVDGTTAGVKRRREDGGTPSGATPPPDGVQDVSDVPSSLPVRTHACPCSASAAPRAARLRRVREDLHHRTLRSLRSGRRGSITRAPVLRWRPV